MRDIETISPPSGTCEEMKHYIDSRTPVKVSGVLEHWAAFRELGLHSLRAPEPNALAAIQHGNIEQGATDLSQQRITDYLDELRDSKANPSERQHGYLAQIDGVQFASRIHELFPIQTLLPRRRHLLYPYLWIGPAGTVTGLHRDDSNNVLGQIEGSKVIHLISPADTKYVYKSAKYDPGADLSCVDAEKPDLQRYPLFSNSSIYVTTLRRGDILFIPVGWWHQVRSTEVSVSVSCFFQTRWEYAKTVPGELLQQLHNWGVYRPQAGCICHSDANRRLRNN